jgi:hypothetical protein
LQETTRIGRDSGARTCMTAIAAVRHAGCAVRPAEITLTLAT